MGHGRHLRGHVPGAVDPDGREQLAEPGGLEERPDDHQAADAQGRRREQGDDQARAAVGATLAGTAPYLRDGGGNVVTVSRQSLGSTDDNENFVDISGVTIESGGVAAEALRRVLQHLRPDRQQRASAAITPAGPYGYGLIMTNSLQGAEAGVRRQVTLEKSVLATGGVFFDDARGADGTATTTARSGITAYGNIVGSRVAGPVTYTYGQRGLISGSELSGPLTLTDAELGPDPSNPAVRAFSVTGSSLVSLTNSGAGTALAAGELVGLGERRRRPARSTSARRWPPRPRR